jgi:hypothetical protein
VPDVSDLAEQIPVAAVRLRRLSLELDVAAVREGQAFAVVGRGCGAGERRARIRAIERVPVVV